MSTTVAPLNVIPEIDVYVEPPDWVIDNNEDVPDVPEEPLAPLVPEEPEEPLAPEKFPEYPHFQLPNWESFK